MEHCWKLHGTPETVVSDRGPTFASKFMKELYQALKIRPRLSTAYHPETDGQTERINQMVEAFLRTYVSFRQHDWASLLPFAEFAYNNSFHSSIGMTPFFANSARHPSIDGTPLEDGSVPEASAHAQRIHDNLEEAKASLTLSKERDKEYADQRRLEDPFIIGDKVWLSHDHISSNRPSIKLSHKRLGPFTILEAIGRNAYKLELPPSMTMHPVVNVSRLAKYEEDEIKGRVIEPPPPIETPEGEEEYEVELIQSSKVEKGTLKYLVKWKGYTTEHDSWEPLENLGNASELISEFHREHPEAIKEVPKVTRKRRHEETKEDSAAEEKEERPIRRSKRIKEAAGIQVPHQQVFTSIPPALELT
uniref:Chromo domain-containing protein n=1 Tax=Globodera pallida TaxID=36090 RepID=A0A183CNF2_GLOPA